ARGGRVPRRGPRGPVARAGRGAGGRDRGRRRPDDRGHGDPVPGEPLVMTPFWLQLGAGVFVAALVGLGGLAASIAMLFVQRQRRAAEALRRLVLDQLLLAVQRGLPLPRALSVLGEELDRRASPHPGGHVLVQV